MAGRRRGLLGSWRRRLGDFVEAEKRRREKRREAADPFTTWVARLIVAVSIVGAFVSLRASESVQEADDLHEQAAQERVLEEQAEARASADVERDLDLLGPLEEHTRTAAALFERSDRADDPEVATSLAVEAQAENLQSTALYRYFYAWTPTFRPDGAVAYDQEAARRFLAANDPDLFGLRPVETAEQADEANDRAVGKVAAGATLVASIFFLTLSQVSRRSRERLFAGAGVATALIGVLVFALV